LFPELLDQDAQEFLKGSARIALEVEPSFNRYIFIEKKPDKVNDLLRLKSEFLTKANRIEIVNDEANSFLTHWCESEDWKRMRAVVFLDPYGMQVTWSTIVTIAKTQAIDLWILFPLGMGVNRMLTKRDLPPESWSNTLTEIFGTTEWQEAFYPKSSIQTLFGDEITQIKDADFGSIRDFFVNRLKTIFTAVATNPLPLRNSKNTPLFLLCFASGNPKGSKTAIKIAQDILKR
jgi:three-Cys-motif partner protein